MLATEQQIKEMELKESKLFATKFTIDSEVVKGIKTIIKGHKKSSLPILENIVIEVINEKVIKVKYTDHDLFVEKMFSANVENIVKKEFVIPISFIKGIKYIKKNEVFSFEHGKDNNLTFIRNNVKQNIVTFDIQDYPSFDFLEETDYRYIETASNYNYFEYKDLEVLNKASKTVLKTESRPAIMQLHIKDSHVVSTDSHRLFKAKTVFKLDEEFLINPILVQKSLDICGKDMFLKMAVSDNRIKIEDDYSTKIYYNHSDFNYPDTTRLIPTDFNYEIEVDMIKELYDFVKDFKKDKVLNFRLNAYKNEISLQVKDDETITSMVLPINVNKASESVFDITFNARFLKDAIEQLDKETVVFKMHSNVRPFIIKKQVNAKELALLLPIRRY